MGGASEVKALLDTHTWLWYLIGDGRLSQTHRNLLPINEAPGGWIWNALQVCEAGTIFAIALRSRALALSHQDPADRFVGATSIEMKAPLLTADERLCACPDLHCL